MSSSKDSHLYGAPPKPRKIGGGKEISSSTTLSFTSQLSSLIANNPPTTKQRASKRGDKADIFKTHNRNFAQRAAADLKHDALSSASQQKHTTNDTSTLDADTWKRAQNKMQEKARLYAAMKRGDVNDEDEKYAVDFDRKWAETRPDGGEGHETTSDEDNDSDDELVEYVDEFDRPRTGTKRDKIRAERARRTGEVSPSMEGLGARPLMPDEGNIIYGDAIQAEAFDPDKLGVLGKMEELAKKRDRSLTPPPDEHFDSRKEVRRKGTGFFAFSEDAEERKRQMDDLEKQRTETERVRAEREGKLEARRKEIEKRREELKSKRGKRKADEFLDLLGEELSEKKVNTAGTEMTARIEAAVENEDDDGGVV